MMRGWSTQLNGGRAYGSRLNISPKHAMEICNNIRGKPVAKATGFLERVAAKKEYVKLHRFNSGVAHKPGGIIGRYHVKAAKAFIKLLGNAVNSAEQKGMDKEKLRVVHAAAHRGPVYRRRRSKGRIKSSDIDTVNVELVVK
jgi:large subunit ribosomal protein L22